MDAPVVVRDAELGDWLGTNDVTGLVYGVTIFSLEKCMQPIHKAYNDINYETAPAVL